MSQSTDRIVLSDDQGAEEPQWTELGDGVSVRVSSTYVIVDEHWIPETLEIRTRGTGAPEMYARVETGDDEPRLTELRFSVSDPAAEGIRQRDLRDVEVQALVSHFVAIFTVRVENAGTEDVRATASLTDDAFEDHVRAVEATKARKTHRKVTRKVLSDVAAIYRENIAGHPTKAVQDQFKVSQRTAAGYVARARAEGFLPPTVQGKKQA